MIERKYKIRQFIQRKRARERNNTHTNVTVCHLWKFILKYYYIIFSILNNRKQWHGLCHILYYQTYIIYYISFRSVMHLHTISSPMINHLKQTLLILIFHVLIFITSWFNVFSPHYWLTTCHSNEDLMVFKPQCSSLPTSEWSTFSPAHMKKGFVTLQASYFSGPDNYRWPFDFITEN